MRTSLTQLHLPHHESRWWVVHTAIAMVVVGAVLYGAAVLLVIAGRYLL